MSERAANRQNGILPPSLAGLFFVALIILGWALMLASPSFLMVHHHEAVPVWPVADIAKALVMWMIMVLAMMVPTLAPLFFKTADNRPKLWPSLRFLGGYLSVWLVFCVVAVFFQWVFRTQLLLDMHMTSANKWFAAGLLVGAGVFQWSGIKSRHLNACRLSLKRMHLNDNSQQNLARAGFHYGSDCIKCCWPMMATMFVFGLMNVLAMGVLTIVMVLEKTSAHAPLIVKIFGLVFIVAGVAILII